MKKDSNAFKNLQQLLESINGQLRFLDVSVPVETQMEYFRYSENVKNSSSLTSVEEQIGVLHSSESSPKELKYALTYLAVSSDIKAYRVIESYNKEHSDNWVAMCLLQAKITLEAELSGEKHIFISTGLGGKGDQLRFSALFKANHLRPFSNYQKELIEKEIPYFIEQYGGVVEEIKTGENYFTILFLIRFSVDIKTLFEHALNECNQYGDFINKFFSITNIKAFSEEEIQEELHK
jgi:hypothetical protein